MTKKHVLTTIFGFIALFAVLVTFDTIQAEKSVLPPKIEAQATIEERIVTGLCTFGDCPVASLSATEMSFANTTELETEEYSAVDEDYSAIEPVTEWDGFDKDVVDVISATTTGGYIGTMYITGYTAEEGFYDGSATASGYGVRSGYCAMNDSQRQALGIRYGDQIYVEGLGTYTVMDCGCGWGTVDIWVYTNAEAYAMTGYYEVYYV